MRSNIPAGGGGIGNENEGIPLFVKMGGSLLLEKYGVNVGACGEQKWTMCEGVEDAKVEFAAFGAEVIHFTEESRGYYRFMVKMEHDGRWYYAHTNGTSCYIAMHVAYVADTGENAYVMREHDIAVGAFEAGIAALTKLVETIVGMKVKVENKEGK